MAGKKEKKGKALVNADTKIETNIKATGKATDLGGLGAAAKTKAAHEIAKAIASPLGNAVDTAATAIFGGRAARVRAEARVLEAEAEAKAQTIAVESELQLDRLRLTAQRVRQEELRKTSYIEAARDEAIAIANHLGDKDARPLEEELTLAWVDGVKDTHSGAVRKLYAQILANQTQPASERISGPSLALLRNLDGHLAGAFERYVAYSNAFGCYPFMQGMMPSGELALPVRDISLLVEIGFLRADTMSEFQFHELKFSALPPLTLLHPQVNFTQRALELSNAIYGDMPLLGELKRMAPTPEEVSEFYLQIALVYSGAYPGNFVITIGRVNQENKIVMVVMPSFPNKLDQPVLFRSTNETAGSAEAAKQIQALTGISNAARGGIEKIIDHSQMVEIYEAEAFLKP